MWPKFDTDMSFFFRRKTKILGFGSCRNVPSSMAPGSEPGAWGKISGMRVAWRCRKIGRILWPKMGKKHWERDSKTAPKLEILNFSSDFWILSVCCLPVDQPRKRWSAKQQRRTVSREMHSSDRLAQIHEKRWCDMRLPRIFGVFSCNPLDGRNPATSKNR